MQQWLSEVALSKRLNTMQLQCESSSHRMLAYAPLWVRMGDENDQSWWLRMKEKEKNKKNESLKTRKVEAKRHAEKQKQKDSVKAKKTFVTRMSSV